MDDAGGLNQPFGFRDNQVKPSRMQAVTLRSDMRYNHFMAAEHQPVWIRVVLLREGDFWVAQALEYDIAAQGRDIEGAKRAFLRTFSAQVHLDLSNGREPLAGIGRAPDWYFDAFRAGRPLSAYEPIEPIETIPYYIVPAVSQEHANAT